MLIAARNLQSADRSRARSNAVLATSANLEELVLDLETGLRGYLLAGKPVFLQPYDDALRRYPVVARTLESTTSGDPTAHALSVSIAAATRAYVTHWADPVIRLAQRNLAAARRAEA